MATKKVWVITQKQKSRGCFRRRTLHGERLPIFTKHVSLSRHFNTQERATEFLSSLVTAINSDIKEIEESVRIANSIIDKLLTCSTELELSKIIQFSSLSISRWLFKHTDTFNEKRQNVLTQCQKHLYSFQTSLDNLKKELEIVTTKMFVNEIDYEIRIKKTAKYGIRWLHSDREIVCNVCGSEMPDVDFLSIGRYHENTICLFCLEKLSMEAIERLKKCDTVMKEVWEQTIFINGLG